MAEIRENLNQATAGVVCLTRENLNERWLLYEAGALSTKVTDRVWTFLLDVDHLEVTPPLSEFLHTKAEKPDVLKLVRSIHKTVVAGQEKTCTEADLEKYFDASGQPNSNPKLQNFGDKSPYRVEPKVPPEEIRALWLRAVNKPN